MGIRPSSLKFWVIHIVVAVITLASVLMQWMMRDGLPTGNVLEDRIKFIAENNVVWPLSWSVWMASAIGLFIFCVILSDSLSRSFWRTIGLSLVAIGIAPDLTAEVIFAFVIPESLKDGSQEIVYMLETMAIFMTGFLANGLYNLGGLLLTVLAFRERLLERWVFAWGALAWILGLMLSLAIALRNFGAAEILTAASMVLSAGWMLIFAYRVVRR